MLSLYILDCCHVLQRAVRADWRNISPIKEVLFELLQQEGKQRTREGIKNTTASDYVIFLFSTGYMNLAAVNV